MFEFGAWIEKVEKNWLATQLAKWRRNNVDETLVRRWKMVEIANWINVTLTTSKERLGQRNQRWFNVCKTTVIHCRYYALISTVDFICDFFLWGYLKQQFHVATSWFNYFGLWILGTANDSTSFLTILQYDKFCNSFSWVVYVK